MTAPTWAVPPPIGGPQDPRSSWMETLRPLMAHPGRWAVVRSGTPSAINQTAQALRVRQRHIPPGEWHFTVRTFRRGVHVGDMNVAQLYACYVGPTEDYWLPGLIAQDASFNNEGERVCPECGERLERREGRGAWPRKCDACWALVKSKWARHRRRWWVET